MKWVIDVVVMEQFFDALPPDVQTCLLERKFKGSKEAGQLVDDYIYKQGRRSVRTRSHNYQ